MFQAVPEVRKSLFTFLYSCFFLLFWLDVYLFLLFQIAALSPGFLLVTVGSLNILLYFIWGIFHFLIKLNQSVSILITRALNSPSDRLAISSSLSSLSEVLLCSFIWAVFLCLGALVMYVLGIHQSRATHFAALWLCMCVCVGEGWSRGNNAAHLAFCWLSVTFPTTHK